MHGIDPAHDKKEKKRETPIQSIRLYVRERETERLAQAFPELDHSRHKQILENPKLTGHPWPDNL